VKKVEILRISALAKKGEKLQDEIILGNTRGEAKVDPLGKKEENGIRGKVVKK